MDRDWFDRAVCLGLPPDWWFPPKKGPDTTARAKAVCAMCPVSGECLEFSMIGGRRYAEGIYGGYTAKERRTMRRRRERRAG